MSINSEHLLIIPAKLPFFCQSTGKNVGVFSRGGSNSCCGRHAGAFSTLVFEGRFSEWEEEKFRSEVVFPTSEKNFSTSEVDFADDFWPDVGFLSTVAVSRSWRCARMYFQAAHLTCAAHLL